MKKIEAAEEMKILFIINAFNEGGAARVTANIGNELSSRGHTVFIITDSIYKAINYEINKKIALIPMLLSDHYKYTKPHRYWKVLRNIRIKLKNIKPNVIIGIMPMSFALARICSLGLSIPVIASDHTSFNNKDISRLDNFIRFHLYSFADAVTILTQSDYNLLGKRLPKKIVMPNPLQYDVFHGESIRKKNILAVGRLDSWWTKGFDILIEIWGHIARKYPDWILEMAGSGSNISLQKLKSMCVQFGIEDRVNFLGFCMDIDSIMQKSSIFVLSSRYEGFGLVLTEAMSQGCACISFDCAGRQKEIITSQASGIIIENQDKNELENALIRLIEDDNLRNSISEAGKQEVIRYSKETITDHWETLLNHITGISA